MIGNYLTMNGLDPASDLAMLVQLGLSDLSSDGPFCPK